MACEVAGHGVVPMQELGEGSWHVVGASDWEAVKLWLTHGPPYHEQIIFVAVQ